MILIRLAASTLAKSLGLRRANLLQNSFNWFKPHYFNWSFKESTETNFRSYSGIHTGNAAEVKEIEIPVPYGKLAGKAWGAESASPVLVIHGWLLNCGTFDSLIPLLSDQFYFVAIDAPGHGKSSHRPPSSMYTDKSMVIDYKRVIDHLGWKKFSLIGHSLGASHGFLFSAMFPDRVDKFVAIDNLKAYSLAADAIPGCKQEAASKLLDIEKKLLLNPAPVYDEKTAIRKMIEASLGKIDEEGAKLIMNRGAIPSDCGKGFVFTRDIRCYGIAYLDPISHESAELYMSNMRCRLLVILSNIKSDEFRPNTPEEEAKIIAKHKNNLENFVLEYVDSNHFGYINNPEIIAPIINKFLLSKYQ